jgi:hypothetical protein
MTAPNIGADDRNPREPAMFDFSNASRTVFSAVSALLISTICVTAAVGPVKAAVPVSAPCVTDASTPAR